jgi:pantetheine-phosphate adenylyltransferase
MAVAIYQGTFDPITNGHVDVVVRAAGMFDRLVVGVFDTPFKSLLFPTQERLTLVQQSTQHLPNVEAQVFTGLTVEFAREVGAIAMIRGLRSTSDFDNEFAMNMMNRKLSPEIYTLFLMPAEEYSFVSSSLIKEVAQYGGNVGDLVPKCVAAALREKIRVSV